MGVTDCVADDSRFSVCHNGFVFLYISWKLCRGAAEISLRLKALEGSSEESVTVIDEEMSVSFKNRIATPFFNSISRFSPISFPQKGCAIAQSQAA